MTLPPLIIEGFSIGDKPDFQSLMTKVSSLPQLCSLGPHRITCGVFSIALAYTFLPCVTVYLTDSACYISASSLFRCYSSLYVPDSISWLLSMNVTPTSASVANGLILSVLPNLYFLKWDCVESVEEENITFLLVF